MYIIPIRNLSLLNNMDLVGINKIEPRKPYAIVYTRAMRYTCTSAQGSDVTWHPYGIPCTLPFDEPDSGSSSHSSEWN